MSINIIDCTIRDGGHINKWQFDDYLVKSSYFAASKGQVDYFEIGYKNDENVKELGPYGYCKDGYVASLFKHSTNCKLLAMIDAGKFTEHDIPDRDQAKTSICGIRVASYPYEAEKAIRLVEKFHGKGYEVFLNLMASSEWTDADLRILRDWGNKHVLKAVYFADSFGAYIPTDITAYIRKLKGLGFASIGFHAHNNLQMAFANTIQAVAGGATFIDASIYGMGRGAGNLPVEILLSYLFTQGYKKYNVVPYLDVIERFYLDLFEKYRWGYSLESLMGGVRNVHPYYVAELFKSNNYTIEEVWDILGSIKEQCPISYSSDKLNDALKQRFYFPTSDEAKRVVQEVEGNIKIIAASDAFTLNGLSIANIHKNRKAVIIANGASIMRHEDQIKRLISQENAITIGCNNLKNLYQPTYHLFLSKKKFLKYMLSINPNSTLIIPTFFGRKIIADNYGGRYEYIQINSVSDLNSPSIDGIKQQIVYLNVGISAILTAYQMGASEILACGMDGYEKEGSKEEVRFYDEGDMPEDPTTAAIRYEDFASELKRVNDFLTGQGVPFSIITPTSHKRYYRNMF